MDRDTQVWDFNRVIYGHNMGAGSDAMFSTLLDYEQEDYFKENRTIYFTDAYGSATAYRVMAVVKYSTDDLEEWYFRIRNHDDMESYNAWMMQLQGRRCIMKNRIMRLPVLSHLLPVTGVCLGRMGGFLL